MAEAADEAGNLEEVVNKLCLSREGPPTLKQLLKCLVGNALQVSVMKAMVTENFDNVSVQNKLAESHREYIYTELDRLPEMGLVQLVKMCMEKLREEESPTGYRGLSLLGRLLEVVERRSQVAPDAGLPPFQGSEYKSRLVEEITRMPWSQTRLTSLCSMFEEVRLNKQDLAKVFNKVCSVFLELLFYLLIFNTRFAPAWTKFLHRVSHHLSIIFLHSQSKLVCRFSIVTFNGKVFSQHSSLYTFF